MVFSFPFPAGEERGGVAIASHDACMFMKIRETLKGMVGGGGAGVRQGSQDNSYFLNRKVDAAAAVNV